MKLKVISLQVEPQKWPSDVGPMNPATLRKCGVSCAAIYDLNYGRILAYGRDDIKALGTILRSADHVIGYNSLGFDGYLLAGARIQVSKVHWVDLFDLLRKQENQGTPLSKAMTRVHPVIQTPVSLRNHRRWIMHQDQTRLTEKCVNDALNIARLFRHLQGQRLPGTPDIRINPKLFLA